MARQVVALKVTRPRAIVLASVDAVHKSGFLFCVWGESLTSSGTMKEEKY